MKQLNRRKVISYRWWRADGLDVCDRHVPQLEATAEEKIRIGMDEGYLEGELNDSVRAGDDGPTDFVTYRGWWEVRNESVDPEPVLPKGGG